MSRHPRSVCRRAYAHWPMPFVSTKTPLERFHEKYEVDEESGCWLWTAATTGTAGYGSFQLARRRSVNGHSWYWQQVNGPVPKGLELDHLCGVRRCVNPDHLEPVTHLENVRRGRSAASNRARAKLNKCRRGHDLTPENTYVAPGTGKRKCLTCRRAWRRANENKTSRPAARLRTHCPHGHPYDEENTYVRPDGRGRGCRTCMREASARAKARLVG